MDLSIAEEDIREITGLSGYRLFLHQKRKQIIIDLISRAFPFGSTVLDVGCASGDISVELGILGYKVHGIDFEPIRLSNAKKLADKYGHGILFENKSFEELDKQKSYDIVLLGEVLEHFSDPEKILGDIKSLLNQEGKVVITAPNMPGLRNRLQFGLLGIFPDNNPEHKYYFDFRRFSKVVSDAGYEICHFSTHFTNILGEFKAVAILESILLFWFTSLFPKSGDIILSVIHPKPTK